MAKSTTRPGALTFVVGAIILTAAITTLNTLSWYGTHRPTWAPSHEGKVAGVAYSGYRNGQDPNNGRFPSELEVREDMQLVARITDRIRTYSSLDNAIVPAIAAQYDLKVTAGAWLDRRTDRNRAESNALIRESRANRRVDQLIVGNESLLRGDLSIGQLEGYLREVRSKTRIPVTTAEPWHVWLKHPTLANNVDFITVHLLPYWEGIPLKASIDFTLEKVDELRRMYPKKRIVIGEVGWPSHGDRRDDAYATLDNQAWFVRTFLSHATARGLEYFFMEAFDQPWKVQHEGRAGAYWGLFDVNRVAKFNLSGPILRDPHWTVKGLASAVLAAPFIFWFALRFGRRLRWPGLVLYAALIQTSAALLIWAVTLPFGYYLQASDWGMLALMIPALVATIAILCAQAFEFIETLWTRGWSRRFTPVEPDGAAPDTTAPFVSIHLPCCNEPPEMVLHTLRSLARLDYANFEVIVIDNNTRDPALWQPVRAWCEQAGAAFKFFHLENWPGFKAGALNFALKNMDTRTEIVGVVDADYTVDPRWLSRLVPHFEARSVGVVQAPQAHRDYAGSFFQRMCNWEFDGFFRIGMHHRNERNAIIQHGTMTLVRRTALGGSGGWAEWCICEDAELGLRLMHDGWDIRYVDAVLGQGLTPADFAAFKTQRYRWAFGGMQILRMRWNWLTRRGPLSAGQRYHFLSGWSAWFADALQLVFAGLALVWTIGVLIAPTYVDLPLFLLMIPAVVFLACRAVFGPILYRAKVKCSWKDVFGASLASMALSHAIARGVFAGLTAKRGVFVRTAKGVPGAGWLRAFDPVREEALMAVALAVAIGLVMTLVGGTRHVEALLWAFVLTALALPYAAALLCAGISAFDAARARRDIQANPQLQPARAGAVLTSVALTNATLTTN